MLQLVDGGRALVGHGDVAGLPGIVPVKCQAAVPCTSTVDGDGVQVQFVTVNGDAYAMRFSIVGPDNQYKTSVRDLATCTDIATPHEKNCVGTGQFASSDSLS